MALVGNDEIKFLNGHCGVVGHIARARAAQSGCEFRAGEIVRAFR